MPPSCPANILHDTFGKGLRLARVFWSHLRFFVTTMIPITLLKSQHQIGAIGADGKHARTPSSSVYHRECLFRSVVTQGERRLQLAHQHHVDRWGPFRRSRVAPSD